MIRRSTAYALAGLIALAITPANAKSRYHRDHSYRQMEVTRTCPRYLGCGCHLASFLGKVGHRWRELWVAREWAHEGTRTSHGCVNCIAVISRGSGGHVGIVKGYDANGNPSIYSWANGSLGWTEATYPARRVIAYVSM